MLPFRHSWSAPASSPKATVHLSRDDSVLVKGDPMLDHIDSILTKGRACLPNPFPGLQFVGPAVPRASNSAFQNHSLAQWSCHVQASVIDGVEVPVDVEQCDDLTVDVYASGLTRLKRAARCQTNSDRSARDIIQHM